MGPLLIIYGTRGVTYSAGEGDFHCPSCGQQPYRQRRVRRFFTLYFIPLIPLDKLGEYVECGRCRDAYDVEILQYDPETESRVVEAAFRVAIRRVMSLICLADGVIDDDEVEVIRMVYEKLSGQPLSDEAARTEIANAREHGAGLSDYLREVGAGLNVEGKEMIIRAALLVAAADGEFQQEEQQLIAEIGEALSLSSSNISSIMDDVFGADSEAN